MPTEARPVKDAAKLSDNDVKELVRLAGRDAGNETFLMYMAGIPKMRIAELTGKNAMSVAGTLRGYLYEVPEVRAVHERNVISEPVATPAPPAAWVRRVEELLRYISEHHEYPYKGSPDAATAQLSNWLGSQRRRYNAGNLSTEETRILDLVKGWKLNNRQRAQEHRWQEGIKALQAFYEQTRRIPRYRAEEPTERLIGLWLHASRQRANKGKLTPRQLAEIDAACPGWATGKRGPKPGVTRRARPGTDGAIDGVYIHPVGSYISEQADDER